MSKFARKHHVVPQGYLAAFTDTGSRDGRLGVFDFETRRFFSAKPRNVGAKRDFNRVHVEGRDPDSLEKSLGHLEGAAISVIRKVCTEECVPPDDDFNWVLNLICLLIVRNPTTRRSLVRSRQQEARIIGSMLASNKSLYEHHVREARQAGDISGPDVPFERFRRFVGGAAYRVSVSTDESLQIEFGVFDAVLELLGHRCWSLLVAAPDAPDFLSCDRPVIVVHKNPTAHGPIGFGLPETEVTFPLGPRHTLLGVFENPFAQCVEIRGSEVRMLNGRIVRHAGRQLYSRGPVIGVSQNGQSADIDLRSNRALEPSAP
jgi:hypothetical protein